MPEQWLALLIVGAVAGVAAGMFGIGGGVIIVPALTILLAFDLKAAVGTSLAALLMPVSIFAVLQYYRAGKFSIRTSALIGFGLIFGAIIGAQIALGIDTNLLRQLYGVFLLYMSWRFIEPRKWLAERRGQKITKPASEGREIQSLIPMLALGFIAGIFAGMFGIGGGIIIVAVLVEGFRFDQKQAVGTSLAALLPPVSFGAVIQYYNEGLLNIAVAACVAAGLLLGSIAGAKIALGLPSATIKRLYGIFLVLVGLRYLLQL